MKKDITLVILAAGLGSRYGGLKQIEPMGPSGEFIIDYSIYDAIKAGFTKIVFVIKKENLQIFKEKIGNKIENKVKVEYAFQEMEEKLKDKNLTKPLGTGHALYCARNLINEPFAVISADDFYGREAFGLLYESLKNTEEYSIIGYKIGNTITDNGSVKRGVCFTKDNELDKIVESKVEKINGIIHGIPINDEKKEYTMEEEQPVSMLIYGLRKEILYYLEEDIKNFFNNIDKSTTKEYFLPDVLNKYSKEKNIKIKIIPTDAKWYGVTYKEDAKTIKEALKEMVKDNIYPKNLWG